VNQSITHIKRESLEHLVDRGRPLAELADDERDDLSERVEPRLEAAHLPRPVAGAEDEVVELLQVAAALELDNIY